MNSEDVVHLRRAVARLGRVLNGAATGEGLTPTQASVLGLVAAHGPLSLATVVEQEQINPSMVSRVVKKLVQRGLIIRSQGIIDQRSGRIEATVSGHRAHAAIKAQRTKLVSDCAKHLPATQVAALRAAIPALNLLADELVQEHKEPGQG